MHENVQHRLHNSLPYNVIFRTLIPLIRLQPAVAYFNNVRSCIDEHQQSIR